VRKFAGRGRKWGHASSFYGAVVLEHTLSEEEHSQIVQTIEMFEVILQTQPDDYQSLEILKEAYSKVGRADDSLKTSRRLAEAYFNVGSYTLAMQECEVILLKEPNAPEILAMLGDIETRLQAAGHTIATSGSKNGLIAQPGANGVNGLTHNGPEGGGLMDMQHARHGQNLQDRGDDHLAKFLVMQQLFSEDQVEKAMETVKKLNRDLSGQALGASLLDKICRQETDKLDAALSQLIDRTKFAYVPVEYYDVDRQIPRMLPDNLTLGRLFLPFDLISRTIMVACCNPFDAAGREAVQQSLDYTVTWYLARPGAIIKCLQDVYRLESKA
jgi:tetratricopeptide (TPR) repeat protein